MRKIYLSLVLVAFGSIHCSLNADPNRNIIAFQDSVEMVQNALHDLSSILNSLPQVPKELGVARRYALDDSVLYVNAYHPVKINSLIIPGVSKASTKDFIRLILFLQRNYITGAFKINNDWHFEYRKLYNENYDGYRDIILNESENDTLGLSGYYKILDKKRGILLVAYKDAKIE